MRLTVRQLHRRPFRQTRRQGHRHMQPSRFWGVTRAYVSNLVNIKVAPDSKFEVGKIAANWALMLHTCRFPLGREFHHWWRGQSTEGLRNGWRLQMQKTNWSDFGRPCEDRWKNDENNWKKRCCFPQRRHKMLRTSATLIGAHTNLEDSNM